MSEPALGQQHDAGAPARPYGAPAPAAAQQPTQYPASPYGPPPAALGQHAASGAPVHVDYQEVAPDAYRTAARTAGDPVEQRIAEVAAALPPDRPAPPPGQHYTDTRAEVATEAERDTPDVEYPPGAIAVPLRVTDRDGNVVRAGVVHILATDEWPSDANSAMHVGDYESWADGCLAGDDYERVWVPLAPRMKDIAAMFEQYRALTGQDQGKSLRSPRSLRNAARR